MNTKTITAMSAAMFGLAALAEAPSSSGWSYEPGSGISFSETPIVTAEFGVSFDSRYMTYGVIDGKDPIIVPGATVTFFDWVYFGVEAIFDATKGNGKRGGYGNRAGKYTTLDTFVGIAHEFDLGDPHLCTKSQQNSAVQHQPAYFSLNLFPVFCIVLL